jgi:hypothetical protein
VAAAIVLLVKYCRGSDTKAVQLESPARDPAKSNESLLNRAYGCFAFLGLATLPVGVGILLSVLHWMSFDEGSNGGTLAMLFGMGLAAPLFLGILGATILGISETVRLRHPALVVLSVISIACGGGMIALLPKTPVWNGAPDMPIVDYAIGIASGIYIAGNVLIPAWWFTLGIQSQGMGSGINL